jgi:RecA-family ATPase
MLEGHERTVLSRLLNEPNACAELCDLSQDDFSIPKHRLVFGAIVDAFNAGHEIHNVSVADALRAKGQIENAGGDAEVVAIYLSPSTPESARYALERVRDAARDRQSARIGERLSKREIDATEAIGQLQPLVNATADRLSIRTAGEVLALPRNEHWCLLGDRLLALGQSLVIAGIGGIGKTRRLLQLLAALILGRPWCGIETHARNLRCLLLQAENPTHRLQDDLNALRAWAGQDWPLVESKPADSHARTRRRHAAELG